MRFPLLISVNSQVMADREIVDGTMEFYGGTHRRGPDGTPSGPRGRGHGGTPSGAQIVDRTMEF